MVGPHVTDRESDHEFEADAERIEARMRLDSNRRTPRTPAQARETPRADTDAPTKVTASDGW